MLDDQRLLLVGLVVGLVILAQDAPARQVQHAFDDLAPEHSWSWSVLGGIDQHLQVDAVAEEPLLTRREVIDAGVAGVGVVVQHGQRSLQ